MAAIPEKEFLAVFADAHRTLSLKMSAAIQTIARVTSRSSSSLVRAGTTADVYSINAAQQSRTAVLGGVWPSQLIVTGFVTASILLIVALRYFTTVERRFADVI